MTGIPHHCPWCSARCNCGAEPAAIEECVHDCDAIDDGDEYSAADITDAGYALPDEFDDDGTCDFIVNDEGIAE